MEKAMIRANVYEDEEQTISRFMAGLHRNIQRIVEFQSYQSLIDLVHQATKAERQLQQDAKSTKPLSYGARTMTGGSKSISRFTAASAATKGSTGACDPIFKAILVERTVVLQTRVINQQHPLQHQWVQQPRVVVFSASSVEVVVMS
jgi:hypothetical protein